MSITNVSTASPIASWASTGSSMPTQTEPHPSITTTGSLDETESHTSTTSSVEKVFKLYKPADSKNSLSFGARFAEALGKPGGLKNLTIILTDPSNPEKCIQMRLPICSITNESTHEQTAFDAFLKPSFLKEFLEDGSLKFDLKRILPDELNQKILQYPQILDAYRNYKIGQPISLSLNAEGMAALIAFSDLIGDLDFAFSIPAVITFLLQPENRERFSEKIFDCLILGNNAMDHFSPEYPTLENYISNPYAWKAILTEERFEAVKKAANEGHPPALCAWMVHLDSNDKQIPPDLRTILARTPGYHHVLLDAMKLWINPSSSYLAFLEAMHKYENGQKRICSPFAKFVLGHNNYPDASRYLTESAMGGNMLGMEALVYHHGMCWALLGSNLVEEANEDRLDEEALKLFEWSLTAANAGSLKGLFQLGECFWEGIGTEPNLEEALKWFRESAKRGNQDAIARLESLEASKSHKRKAEQPADTDGSASNTEQKTE